MTLIPALEQELIAAAQRTYGPAESNGFAATTAATSRGRSANPAPAARGRRLWPSVGAGAVTVALTAFAAVALLTGGATPAFAGWTSTPSTPTIAALVSARAACGEVPARAVLAAESRGPYTAISFNRAGKLWQCVARGAHRIVDLSSTYPSRAYAPAVAGKVMLPLITEHAFGKAARRERRLENAYESPPSSVEYAKQENKLQAELNAAMSGPQTLSAAIGVAGHGVSAVVFELADGDRVRATVQNGWYVAWWPGASKPGGATAVRVAVTTASGTRSSPMPVEPKLDVGYRMPARGCVPGARCSVLVPLELVNTLPVSLTSHYAMFDQTRPVSPSREPRVVRDLIQRSQGTGAYLGDLQTEYREMTNGQSLGLDPDQVRSLYVGNHYTLWLLPGSEGFCQARVRNGDGGAGCGPVSSFLRYGAITNPGTITVRGRTRFLLAGFVPNGNRNVTVRLDSGSSEKIRVRHNAFTAAFASQPVSLTFRDSAGKIVTDPAPATDEV